MSKNWREGVREKVQVGQMFGRWCVKSSELLRRNGRTYVLVSDGKVEDWKLWDNVKRGKSKGSLKTASRYGIKGYPKYRGRWEAMMDRCHNPQSPTYSWYGERGIEVSEEFKSCVTFVKYITQLEGAYDPERGDLDRIDNDKGYERGNLRWVTRSQNSRNQRGNRIVEYKGKKYVFIEFVEKFTELPYDCARKCLSRGLSLEEIIEYRYVPRGRYRKCRG